ncbi:MAG: hypothetical protein CMC76_02025 [Flavobacteriaceae bacterium]|nr:hypothetical protein [Flavobacteriaceae bacterium]
MRNKKIALQFIALGLLISSFIACDKDFSNIESDIINSDNATNFDILSLKENHPEFSEVIAYTDVVGPVQTNNGSGINTLGIYDDIYGRTTASFVTQLTTSSFDPDFGGDDFQQIDSVVLRLPYYSLVTDVDDDGNVTYEIDSVIGRDNIRLRIFENEYFIRDFDPAADFDESQAYYSDMTASGSESVSPLEGEELSFVKFNRTTDQFEIISNEVEISEDGHVLKEENEDGELEISERLSPGIRVLLDRTYWQNKIINREGDAVLSSQNNFSDYFRGLYFKAEPVNDDGSFLILNTASQNANITIYYKRLTASTTDDVEATEQGTFVLRFGPNRINFIENDFSNIPLTDGNSNEGDSRLYLKGGPGSVAKIKLFDGENVDDIPEMNNFETFKNLFVETDEGGKFVKSKRLVNEANLVFYVDDETLNSNSEDPNNEPNRIFVYDVDNKTPLFDYSLDVTNSNLPSFSKFNHLGPLQRDETTDRGIKYKIKITDHINNLLINDSTNVELGLAVSLNVNLESNFLQPKQKSAGNNELSVPISSILSPRGTILYGSNTESQNEDKKVYLEIHYTEPNEY